MSELQPVTTIEVEQYLNKLRTGKDLAKELGVSFDYIKAMKWHGFVMPGNKASLRMATVFLSECKGFSVSTTTHHPKTPAHSASSSGKSHEPILKHGRRKPSSDSQKTQPHTTLSPQ